MTLDEAFEVLRACDWTAYRKFNAAEKEAQSVVIAARKELTPKQLNAWRRMSRSPRSRRERARDEIELINSDPSIGPTVKALLNLSAFASDRKRYAKEIRERLERAKEES